MLHSLRTTEGITQYKIIMTQPNVLFQPFSSSVSVDFWFELAKKKVEEYKLSESPVPIHGQYNNSQFSISQETKAAEGGQLPNIFSLDSNSLRMTRENAQTPKATNTSPGTLYNTNTVESFTALVKDSGRILDRAASQVINETPHPI